MKTVQRLILFLLTLFTLTSCYRVENKLEPQVSYSATDTYLKSLPSPFPPLSYHEKQERWGQEYEIGLAFADRLDLYKAITSFQRAEILIPKSRTKRLQEIQYQIIFAYYLGQKYGDAIDSFEESSLQNVEASFPTYHDLLVILYTCYRKIDDEKQASYLLKLLDANYPETAEKLQLSSAISDGNICEIRALAQQDSSGKELIALIESYEREKKSVPKAELLNAVIPGAGYLYVGQKQSALTAFLLNGLFIAAAIHFFCNDHVAAGIITTSFEAGWYLGGIYGAGESAKLYNERVYERKVSHTLYEKKLYPILMLQYGF